MKLTSILSALALVGISVTQSMGQSPVSSRSGLFFEFCNIGANFNGYTLRYKNDANDATPLVDLNIVRAKRQFDFAFGISQEIAIKNRFLIRFDYSLTPRRDHQMNLGLGIGYMQPIAQYSKVPMFLRVMALYDLWNYGIWVGNHVQTAEDLRFNKKTFKAREVMLFMGQRAHSFRPHLGFSFQLVPGLELALEGYYNITFADQSRVWARGKTFWPKRATLPATDSRLEIRDTNNNVITKWDRWNRWGVRIGLIYRTGSDV